MINKYRFVMPTPERANALGYKVEGQVQRTHLWLMGVAFALPTIESNLYFKVDLLGKTSVEFSTDSIPLFQQIWEVWKPYGIECFQIGGLVNGETITENNFVQL